MNTNVGEMPLEIFADYSSDMLDEEWYWEYLALTTNGYSILLDHGEYDGEGYHTEGSGQWSCGYYGHGFGDFQFRDHGGGMQNVTQYGSSLDYYEY